MTASMKLKMSKTIRIKHERQVSSISFVQPTWGKKITAIS